MKKYGLIGHPLEHSFSKIYFERKFREEHIHDCSFELYDMNNINELTSLLINTPDLKGLAVTIPYKVSVLPFLDEMDEIAGLTGAVNCIRVQDKKCIGYNTDAAGFEKSLVPLLKEQHNKALILGSGGASRAVQYTLRKLGITCLSVTRRTQIPGFSISYDDVDEAIVNQYPLIINCTPLGMYPEVDSYPILPYAVLNDKNLLFDLVYKPEMTKFLLLGKQSGASIKNGYEMLCLQAEENWKNWNQ